jgi:hypothetical protein
VSARRRLTLHQRSRGRGWGQPLAVCACNEQRPKDKYELVEYLRVEGTCFENHVREPAKYFGELVHWRDLTERRDMRYGFVRRPIDVTEMAREIKNPNKYFPPNGVQFYGLTAKDISGDVLTLTGLSDQNKESKSYESTCMLTVLKRLNYFPPDSER